MNTRWTAEKIDAVRFKPEVGEEGSAEMLVRVWWAPWVDAAGRAQPQCATWEPVKALGLPWGDIRDLVRPDATFEAPRHGLTPEEKVAVRMAAMRMGIRSGIRSGIRRPGGVHKKKRGAVLAPRPVGHGGGG